MNSHGWQSAGYGLAYRGAGAQAALLTTLRSLRPVQGEALVAGEGEALPHRHCVAARVASVESHGAVLQLRHGTAHLLAHGPAAGPLARAETRLVGGAAQHVARPARVGDGVAVAVVQPRGVAVLEVAREAAVDDCSRVSVVSDSSHCTELTSAVGLARAPLPEDVALHGLLALQVVAGAAGEHAHCLGAASW